MSKGKLQKFAEMKSFPNVVQPAFSDVFHKDFKLKGQWNSGFFKKEFPLTLELGCGRGEYTVEMGRMFPEQNFIGIDIKGARIWKGAKAALDNQMENVGFIRTRIDFVNSFFSENEVSEIWITFPDPQPKKIRKRLTSAKFLNLYKNFLKADGIIHLKTDNHYLYEYTLELAQHNKLIVDYATENIYDMNIIDDVLNIKTYYEEMWLEDGLDIHYLKFRLKGTNSINELPDAEK